MTSLNDLVKILKPPLNPVETTKNGGWQEVESTLKVSLPQDYKEYISIYGAGSIDNFLWVLNPFSKNDNLNLLKKSKLALDALRTLRDHYKETIPFPIHPEVSGVFPWGITDNGDILYWLCHGDPSTWIVIVNESRGPQWQKTNKSFCHFLNAMLTRELTVDVFPEDFPTDSPVFMQPS